MENKDFKILKLSSDVLMLSRNSLIVHLRFLDVAISMLKLVPNLLLISISTDGKNIYFNPEFVLSQFRISKDLITRSYVHMIMHCVFRHNIVSTLVDQKKWNLACDITVENIINDLNLDILSSPNETKQNAIISNLKSQVKYITAEKIYYWLLNQNFSDKKIQEWSILFGIDNHDIWYQKSDKSNQSNNDSTNQQNKRKEQNNNSNNNQDNNQNQNDNSNNQDNNQNQNDNSNDQDNNQNQNDNSNNQDNNQDQNDNSNNQDNNQDQNDNSNNQGEDQEQNSSNSSSENFQNIQSQLEQDWKEVAEKMQTDLETFSKQQGDTAGGLMQNLTAVNREKYDYTEFLKKFAVMGEAMKINDDEFDYIFYTYGMNLFANEGRKMPLIEPLEYKDVKRIKEFIIAIDTSGSVEGELVQKFIQKTYNILKQEESFFTKINLHIVQCDTEIQEDKKITNQEEFDEYLKTMTLHGFGGTDFRPVFHYVDKLIKNKEFTNLKGLIYFTDGWGDFPSKQPGFNTAFVFIDDDYNNYDVPVWAIKLILQRDEI